MNDAVNNYHAFTRSSIIDSVLVSPVFLSLIKSRIKSRFKMKTGLKDILSLLSAFFFNFLKSSFVQKKKKK